MSGESTTSACFYKMGLYLIFHSDMDGDGTPELAVGLHLKVRFFV